MDKITSLIASTWVLFYYGPAVAENYAYLQNGEKIIVADDFTWTYAEVEKSEKPNEGGLDIEVTSLEYIKFSKKCQINMSVKSKTEKLTKLFIKNFLNLKDSDGDVLPLKAYDTRGMYIEDTLKSDQRIDVFFYENRSCLEISLIVFEPIEDFSASCSDKSGADFDCAGLISQNFLKEWKVSEGTLVSGDEKSKTEGGAKGVYKSNDF